MSYRDGSQSAGFDGSLVRKALGAHPEYGGGVEVRRVNSKVGSPPWTPTLETASGFLPEEQNGRCLWPALSSLPPSPFLQSTEEKPGAPSEVDSASSTFVALGPFPGVQDGGAGEAEKDSL